MSEELKVVVDSVKELRSLVDSKLDENSAEYKGKMDKINADLEAQEAKNQELTKSMLEKENEATELKERMDEFEKKLSRPSLGGEALDNEKKAFDMMIKRGENAENLERKYLRTDVNTEGGYLAPAEYINEIIKGITEISDVRSIAKVRTTSKGEIVIPSETSLSGATWTGEGEAVTDSNATYGEIKIPVNKLSASIPVTVEMLSDASFNIESEILSTAGLKFGQTEGAAFVSGDGVKKPEGFITNSNVASINSGSLTAITADNIIDLAGTLKRGYNPVYVLNRSTLTYIQKMKASTAGTFLWQAGLADGTPATLNGYRYLVLPDMQDIGSANLPLGFGDFNRGYTIVDHSSISVVRDVYSLKKSGKVEFTFMKRTGGGVVLPEAIKLLKCAV